MADKIDDTPFDQDELRLLTIIASQSAIIIENASLVRQSQDRAQRSEALRRIASLSGSLATLDEILAFSMQEIFRLLRTDFAAIFLIDENQAELRLHQESLFGATIETTSRLGRISLTEPDFYHTVTGSQKTYSADDVVIDLTLIPFYRNLTGAFQLRSVMIIPLIVRNRGIGEILLGNGAAPDDPSAILPHVAAGLQAGKTPAAAQQTTFQQSCPM